jgi:pectinesterase
MMIRREIRSTLILAASGMVLAISSSSQQVDVTVTNSSDFARPRETVVVQWDQLKKGAHGLDAAGVAVLEGSTRLVSQTIDLDRDGKPDELLFQTDLAPKQTKVFRVKNDAVQGAVPSRVDARFVLPRQDLAWENDRVAFRIYGSELAGNVRNGIDVWTKRVRSLIVEKWYRESEGRPPGKDSYHVDQGEGADFFSVGTSLGAGSCGLWVDRKLHQSGLFSAHRVIATGPIRAMFEARYDNGNVNGTPFTEVKRISLDAGSDLNTIEVTFSGKGAQGLVATGLVRRKGVEETRNVTEGWLTLWGPVNDDPVNGSLGTAIVIPAEEKVEAGEDSTHALAYGRFRPGKPFTYYAGAGWTRMGDHPDNQAWISTVKLFARKVAEPVKIRVGR